MIFVISLSSLIFVSSARLQVAQSNVCNAQLALLCKETFVLPSQQVDVIALAPHAELKLDANIYRHLAPLALISVSSTFLSKAVLMFATSVRNVHDSLQIFAELWSPRNQYVIVCDSCETDVTAVLKEMWDKRNVYTSVLVCGCDVYTYAPFADKQNVVRVANFTEIGRRIRNGVNNLQGSPLRILLFPQLSSSVCVNGRFVGGYDWGVLMTLKHAMNFKPVISEPSDGKRFGDHYNNSFKGSLKDIIEGKADIALNGYFLKDYGTDKFILTNTVSLDAICFIVPQADRLSHFESILHIFQFRVWIFLISVYIFLVLVFYILVRRVALPDTSRGKILFNMYSLFVTGSFNIPSNAPAVRILLAFSLLSVLIINNTYQGALITYLSMPLRYSNIDSLRHLIVSKLIIAETRIDWKTNTTEYEMLSKKVKVKENNTVSYKQIARVARFISSDVYKFKNFMRQFNGEEQHMHVVSECPISYYLAYVVRKDSPYLERVNRLLRVCVESGIIIRWDNLAAAYKRKVTQPQDSDELNYAQKKALTIHDLDAAFGILVVGLAASFFVFVCENLLYIYNLCTWFDT